MRTLSQILFLVLSSTCLWADSDWELVYPIDYPQKEDLVPLSIAVHHDRQAASEYLIGGRDGYVLYAKTESPLDPLDWQVVKLPLDADITAASHANGTWILGTESGSVIRYQGTTPGLSGESSAWQISRITGRPISSITAIGQQHILAASDYDTHESIDAGVTWRENEFHHYSGGDLEVFNNAWYGIRSRYTNNSVHLQLLRSTNGQDWETVWLIDMGTARLAGANLRVLSGSVDQEGYPLSSSERLHLSAYITQTREDQEQSTADVVYLSTADGIRWLDTGSSRQILVHENDGGLHVEEVEWNPLSLPNDQIHFTHPQMIDNFSGDLDTNLLVTNTGLYRYDRTEFRKVYSIKQFPGASMARTTISQWGMLMWLSGESGAGPMDLVTLDKQGQLAFHDLPVPQVPVRNWQQLMATANGTFLLAECEDDSQQLFRSTDLTTWQAVPLPPDSRQVILKRKDNHLAAFYKDGDYSGPNRIAVWENGWTVEISLPMRFTDPTYLKQTKRWYCVYPARYSVLIIEITDEGFHREVGRFHQSIMISEARDFNRIASPDDEHFFVFGGTPEIAMFDTTGYINSSIPRGGARSLDLLQVNAVHYVNGWFYVPNITTSRTQDFSTWEVVEVPDANEGIYVTGFGDNLILFTEHSVYRKPLQKGYLDSVESDNGWRYSEWLGWFTITDEAAGLINHLQLGACQVSQSSDLEYSLESSALGAIRIRKDKIPWIFQESTNKWYRLDRETWPPRMWDPELETWIEINP